eukprot:2105277-Prymnesium_polylepis.1
MRRETSRECISICARELTLTFTLTGPTNWTAPHLCAGGPPAGHGGPPTALEPRAHGELGTRHLRACGAPGA